MTIKWMLAAGLLICTQLLWAETPSAIQLGMNGVPVVDQGWEWGTCLTSAITAGLDAYHGWRGQDRISATCLIQLTRSLPAVTAETWWDDGDPMQALLFLSRYGVWTLAEQLAIKQNGEPACGGLSHYPFSSGSSDFSAAPAFNNAKVFGEISDIQRHKDGGMGEAMSIKAYRQHAHRAITDDDWHLVARTQAQSPDKLIAKLKQALAIGDRIVLGVFIDPYLSDHGKLLGALGHYHQDNDSWVLSIAVNNHIDQGRNLSGHAVLITGYDDKACVDQQCGLFTVRNSVGKAMGDQGNYYLSYDYVRAGLIYGAAFAIGPLA